MFVTAITCGESSLVATTGAGGAVKVWDVTQDTETSWIASPVFETRVDQPVKQLLISPDGVGLLISTSNMNTLWSCKTGSIIGALSVRGFFASRWISSQALNRLLLVAESSIQSYSWSDLSDSKSIPCKQLGNPRADQPEETNIGALISLSNGRFLVANHVRLHGDKSTSHLTAWDIRSNVESNAPTLQSQQLSIGIERLSPSVRCVLGAVDSKLIFLDRKLWVSSIDFTIFSGQTYTRHFFIPNDFLGGDAVILALVTPNRRVVFAKDGELVVIEGGLDFEEVVEIGVGE